MAEYITLLGAEQVQSAARTIDSAADTMQRAASNMDESLTRHARSFEENVQMFAASVGALGEIEAMKADNEHSKVIGSSLGFGEQEFLSVLTRYGIAR